MYGTQKKFKEDHPKDLYHGRAYNKMNKDKFRYDMTHNWVEVYSCQEPEHARDIFKTDFVAILDKHAPLKPSIPGVTGNRG